MNWQTILDELRPLEVPSKPAVEPIRALSDAMDRLVQLTDRAAKLQFRTTEATETSERSLNALRVWIEAHLVTRERECESLRVTVGEQDDELRRFTLGIADMLDVLSSAESAARREGLDSVGSWLARLMREQSKIAQKLGLEASAHVGEEFNPELHEALELVEGDQASKSIVEVVRQGYRWRGQVVRIAKVTVRL